MKDPVKYEQLLLSFLESGQGFFSWFQGKNTPNILDNICRQLGAIEKSLKEQGNGQKFVEFTYLSADHLDELWEVVRRHINEGWQPHGTLVVGTVEGSARYFQAVGK